MEIIRMPTIPASFMTSTTSSEQQRTSMVRNFSCHKLLHPTNTWNRERVEITHTSRKEQKVRTTVRAAQAKQGGQGNARDVAVLMEIEGVLADVHRFGHRQGFNVAFQELGLDCAQWTESVYSDLIKGSGGVEERMVSAYFTRIGWPAALATSETDAFVQRVVQIKKQALETLVICNKLMLRPGIEIFIDELMEAGLPVAVIAAYYKGGEDLARLLVERLGPERASKIKIVGKAEVENSSYGQLVFGSGTTASVDEQLSSVAARAVAAEKQRLAEEVASMLALSVDVDTSLSQVSKKTIATLRAAAESTGFPVDRCLLLAGGYQGLEAAGQIAMTCVIVRSSLTARAEFPGAAASLEGYGAGAVTLSRLLQLLQ